jgi:hypothetical protein
MHAPRHSRIVVAVVVLLVLGAGVCLLDGHDMRIPHQALGCGVLLATAVMTVTLPGLLLAGWAPTLGLASIRLPALFVLDPPPKPAHVG